MCSDFSEPGGHSAPSGALDAPARFYAVAQFNYGAIKDFTDREKWEK